MLHHLFLPRTEDLLYGLDAPPISQGRTPQGSCSMHLSFLTFNRVPAPHTTTHHFSWLKKTIPQGTAHHERCWYFIILTLNDTMPLNAPWKNTGGIQHHFSGALKGRVLIFPRGYHSLIRILSSFFTIPPRVIRYHFLSGSFPADITPGILQDKRSTVIRSESTLCIYLKSYSDKTVRLNTRCHLLALAAKVEKQLQATVSIQWAIE